MGLLFTLSWRNIFRHRGRSLVIGAIIFLGSVLMTVGNGFFSGFNTAIQNNIVNVFTGQIAIVSDKQQSDDIFFDALAQP
jgi:ABC-type lipoprotein release transport system permease subunit